jgi:hypothetical protein
VDILCEDIKNIIRHLAATLRRCETFKKKHVGHWLVPEIDIFHEIVRGISLELSGELSQEDKVKIYDMLHKHILDMDELIQTVENEEVDGE